MAKYSVKFEIEVIVDEDFEIGEVNEVLYGEGVDTITNAKWNDIVCDAINNMDTDDLTGNVVEIARVEDWEDEEEDERNEMPWDYGKHFE